MASAWRRFSGGPLAVSSQRFDIDLDHGEAGVAGASIGVGVQNAASNTLWEFFLPGEAANYQYRDGDGEHDSGIPKSAEGLHVSFRLTSSKDYSVEIAAGFSMKKFKGRLIDDPDKAVVQAHVWNLDAGAGSTHDVYVNRMAILPAGKR